MNAAWEVTDTCEVSVRRKAKWDHVGLDLEGRDYWVGVYYSEPEKLWFCTNCQIDAYGNRQLANSPTLQLTGSPCWLD